MTELCNKPKQNEIRYCHLVLDSPATRWHLKFYFLFLNSVILHSCISGNSCSYLLKSPFNTCYPSIIFVGLTGYISIGMHFRHIVGFSPSISVFMFHDQHVFHKWHVCHYFPGNIFCDVTRIFTVRYLL